MQSDDHMHWSAVLNCYKEALQVVADAKKDPSKLLSLDRWYLDGQVQVPGRKAMPCPMAKETLCNIVQWKLTRGTFRPGLLQKAESNSARAVEDACKGAEAHLQAVEDGTLEDVHGAASQAVKLLQKSLDGVGPATATAILARQFPWAVAFMSDEAMLASGLFDRAGDIKYDIKTFGNFNRLVQGKAEVLNNKLGKRAWTGDAVARALWTQHVLDSRSVFKRPSSSGDGPSAKRSRP